MIENPKISTETNEIFYWHANMFKLKNTSDIELVKLTDKKIENTSEGEITVYSFINEKNQYGITLKKELFETPEEAQKFFNDNFRAKVNAIKSKIHDIKDIIHYSLFQTELGLLKDPSSQTDLGFYFEEEIKQAMLERTKELNL